MIRDSARNWQTPEVASRSAESVDIPNRLGRREDPIRHAVELAARAQPRATFPTGKDAQGKH